MPETPPATDFLADVAKLARKVKRDPGDLLVVDSLQRASDRFRGDVRHHVSLVEDDVLILDGGGRLNLRLPVVNIREVQEVTVDERPVEVRFSADGILRRRDGRLWPDDYGCVRVVVTHGLDPIPGDIQAAVLDQAEAVYTVKRGMSSYQVGGISQSFAAVESVGVTEEWARAVTRYRVRAGDRA